MSLVITHAFVSGAADGPDATKLRPSNWNAAHIVSGLTKTDVGLGNVENTALSTGNAATAAALQTARAINGVNFDGTGAITVPAAAATLTGTTLAAGVTGAAQTWAGLQTFNGGASIAGVLTASVNGIAAVETDGFVLQNTTASTAGVPLQQAPRLRFLSHVWNTTTPADNTNEWWLESVPNTGSAPDGVFKFRYSANGAAASSPVQFGSLGSIVLPNSGGITFLSNGTLGPGLGTGLFTLRNAALTAGVGLDVATDGLLKVRTRALSAYADVAAAHHLADDGTSSLPAWTYTSETTLGFYRVGAGIMGLAGGSLTIASSSANINWAARGYLYTTANAQFNLSNQAVTSGVGLDVATDAILKVRTKAHTGYATVDALGYSVSGVAGISFSGAVATLTVVNGIVTGRT